MMTDKKTSKTKKTSKMNNTVDYDKPGLEARVDAKLTEVTLELQALQRLRDEINTLESKARGGSGSGKGNTLGAFFQGRRSMASELVESGGLPSSRLGLEILYLLPDEFVEFYQQLYHRALKVDDASVMHGRSGGLEKAKGSTGTRLGSEVGTQASASGKRFKNLPISVASTRMLKLKEELDSRLVEAMIDVRTKLLRLEQERQNDVGKGGSSSEAHVQSQCQGEMLVREYSPGTSLVAKESKRKCRRFLKDSWRFCPSCGTAVTPASPSQ